MHENLCDLESDGASVMLGTRGGVSKFLKDQVLSLVANHCKVHRLCISSWSEKIYLSTLSGFFFANSAVQYSGEKCIHNMLNNPQLKLVQAKDVRWLSQRRLLTICVGVSLL